MPKDNCEVDIVDYKTGELIETTTFYDPDLQWIFIPKIGRIVPYLSWNCGKPTAEWLSDYPKPRR